MEETGQDEVQARPKAKRGDTLAKLYTGDQKESQKPDERWQDRKAAIEAFYSVSKPIANASESVIVQQVNRFAETSNVLVNALNEVARIHPFISIAIVAFKAVISLELSRKDNDKRITLLLVTMQNTMGTILELNNLEDLGGLRANKLEELMKKLKSDIEDCGSVCDTYRKKHVISRLLKSKFWEPKLQGYIDLFESDKLEIQNVLAMYTAQGVSLMNEKLDDFRATVVTDLKDIKSLFEQLRSPKEKQLLESIRRGAGEDKFKDDAELRKLLLISEGKPSTASDPVSANETKALSSIREEMKEDLLQILADNRKIFDRKLKVQTEILVAETRGAMRREGDRIISAFVRGPYDRIVDPTLHRIWRDMQFRGSVKARQLVLALREYYWYQLHPITTDSSTQQNSPVLSAVVQPPHLAQDEVFTPAIMPSDEWTLRYINIVRIQSLIEAFDDDASGFITVREANQFTRMRLPDWSVPQWIAYWAAGFQISVYTYCDKIKKLIERMQDIAESSLPGNRVPISSYLASHALSKLDRVLAGVSEGQKELRWGDFSDSNLMSIVLARDKYEEERLESKLKEFDWYIDEPSTVTLISGPGRIEMYLFTLLYLLVKRHCLIAELSQTVVINVDEIQEAEESIDNIWTIVQDRLDGLKAVFRQQNFNVDGELRRFCCGMFCYIEESEKNFASMRFEYYPSLASSNTLITSDPQIVTEGIEADDVLQYGIVDDELDVKGYEREKQEALDSDASGLRGLWHGYEDFNSDYPTEGITALTIHDVTSNGIFNGSGLEPTGCFTLKGSYKDQDQDGKSVRVFDFLRKYEDAEDGDEPYYYCGTLKSDEAEGDVLEGFWSCIKPEGDKEITWLLQNSDWSWGPFKLQRKPIEFFTFRPEPDMFAANRVKALWQYAIDAVRHNVQSRLFSWSLMHERRIRRKRYVDLYIKRSEDLELTDEESAELVHLEMTLAPEDTLLYRTLALRSARRLMFFTHTCDNCGRRLESTRYMCFVCTEPAKLLSRKTVDFCSECVHKSFSSKTSTSWNHLPDHDILQTRIGVHPRNYILATERLNAAKDVLQKKSGHRCLLCNISVTTPVWACVTCQSITFVCVECNSREQDSRFWAFSLDEHEKDNSRIDHNWAHPLVLCQPKDVRIAQGRSLSRLEDDTLRIATLEQHMAQMTERMGKLENLLMQLVQNSQNSVA